MALLEVTGLNKRFIPRRPLAEVLLGRPRGILRAVHDVSFTVEAGETVGIVGESGCGKSTLARCLVHLYKPDSGSIRFESADVSGLTGAALRTYHRQVQMVFQDPYGSLNPRKTAGACLSEILRVHDLVPAAQVESRVAALLDMVHLPKSAVERYPHQFSGGQRQRLAIARALAVEPRVIVADEPVSALDVSVQAQIVNLLIELQSRLNLTLIFISHDLRVVRHISHRVLVMYLGRIVEAGPAEQLFTNPRHPYTQALMRALPSVAHIGQPRRRAAAVRGELPSPLAPPPGCAFHPRCPLASDQCKSELPSLEPRTGEWPVACHHPA